jgi:hypoxia up-regulated 1
MAPPGRRRLHGHGSFLYLFASILASIFISSFPSTVSAAGSGVLGIDLGTEYIKAALVKPGVPLEIVLTKDSKRKEASAVAFKPTREQNAAFPERFYGGDALALAARFPEEVYPNLKTLLGVPLETGVTGLDSQTQINMVTVYKERYPALKVSEEKDERGTVSFKSDKFGKEEGKHPFLVEELLAMQLKQIKANAEGMGGSRGAVRDAVITFPPYYTADEKRAVQLAAELAGFKVIGMISDGLAVGTNYATGRTFPNVSDGQKPEYHVVLDMGAGSTTATVLRFQSRTVKDVGKFNKTVQEVQVMGAGWDKKLGGDSLNEVIVNDMVKKLLKSGKLGKATTTEHVKGHGKTMARLWKDAERMRQILSANTATSTTFEGLYNEDVTFKYALTRSDFEKLAEAHAERVHAPLFDAMVEAKLQFKDIDSIILHGGAIRTPFVQKRLEAVCEDPSKLRTSVNADEAAAFGAAFRGAALSRSFKVKEIRVGDYAGYDLAMRWRTPTKGINQKLFSPNSAIGVEKLLTMKTTEDLELTFHQQFTRGYSQIDAHIIRAQTTNLTASAKKLQDDFKCAPANITAQFAVRLRPLDGLPEVVSATVSCEVTEEKKGVVEDVKDGEPVEAIDLDNPHATPVPESDSTEATTSTSTSESTSESETGSASASDTTSSAEPTESEKPKVVKRSINVAIKVTPLGTPPLSTKELQRIKSRLAAFDAADQARAQRDEAFNNLESFIYRGRELLMDEAFLKVVPKDVLAKLEAAMKQADEWLYGGGMEAATKEIKSKLAGLKEMVDPALKRQQEHSVRPTKVEALKKGLVSAQMFLDVIEKQIKQDAEEASSESSQSQASTTSSSTATPSPESASDAFASLEDEPSGSSATGTTSSETPSPSPKPPSVASLFTPEDIAGFNKVYNEVKVWLETKLEHQEKLAEHENPVLTSADMEEKARDLERALNKLVGKMSRPTQQQPPKKGVKNDKAKAQKDKNGNGKKETKSSSSASAASSAEPKQTPHDEL